MGLDINLHHYKKPLREFLEAIENCEKKYKELREETRIELGIDSQDSLGLKFWNLLENKCKHFGMNKYGVFDDNDFLSSVNMPSKKYPNHYFRIGYFRSSYNSSGINYVLRDRLGIDLYDIFDAKDSGYYVEPDWIKC